METRKIPDWHADLDRFPMRRKERGIGDTEEIAAILARGMVGRLGLCLDGYPYVVPVNYVYLDGKIYFHGADEGKKVTYIRNNPLVCFEVDEFLGIIKASKAIHVGTAYRSVIAYGRARFVSDPNVKFRVLNAVLEKYVPEGGYEPLTLNEVVGYRSPMGSHVEVVEITVDRITGKKRENPKS